MINTSSSASVYTDFQGLAELRAEAGKQTPEALRETARQFEALFVQTMLKAMRDASPGGGLFDSDQTEFYREIHDQQLALEMVKGRGLGIADMLVQSMGGTPPAAAAPPRQEQQLAATPLYAPPGAANKPLPLVDVAMQARAVIDLQDNSGKPLFERVPDLQELPATDGAVTADWHPADAATFIRDLMPVARGSAARLGVQPEVLVAQAALETGWGKKMIRHSDGRNSFNLFGIKADSRWPGDRVTVTTLEYEGGVAKKQQAAFRAYGSLAAAMSDYVDFLQSNPRYQPALAQAADPDAFLRGLKEAGYATDPYYVEKIRSIMDGASFGQGLDRLASSGHGADETTTGLW